MTHTFKVGDTGLTQGGRKYRVLAVDLKGQLRILSAITADDDTEFGMQHFSDGLAASTFFAEHTLMPPEKPKQTFREWIYQNSRQSFDSLNALHKMDWMADYLDEQATK